jgi:hypothetical protein
MVLSIPSVSLTGTGIGISGPDLNFPVPQGSYLTSYVWVWNEGDTGRDFQATVVGDAAALAWASPSNFYLEAGESSKVTVVCRAEGDFPGGNYNGELSIQSGGELSTSASRSIQIRVIEIARYAAELEPGVNLIGWMGEDMSFGDVLGYGNGPTKVWQRRSDGTYTASQYYPAGDMWWSPDPAMTGFRYGEAYFIETTVPFDINVRLGSGTGDSYLVPGTNLVVWVGEEADFEQTFPQSPTDCPVIKIWHRKRDGDYESAAYYPSADMWWSSYPSFNSLRTGEAYFIEATEYVQIRD